LRWEADHLSLTTFPSHIRPFTPPIFADLDDDDQDERITLDAGIASIYQGDRLLWSSPKEWHVEQAQITNLNRDETRELTLLLWRDFSPWPIDAYLVHPGRIQDFHNREGRSCHLILIGWLGNEYGELWAGSALADPILAFTSVDLDGDGWDELIGLESQYDNPPNGNQSITIWEWNGFGFSLLQRGPTGKILAARPVYIEGDRALILLNGKLRR
jgi:hypothetical protein